MSSLHIATDSLPEAAAEIISDAFQRYMSHFHLVTARAPVRFELRDWLAIQRDVVERLELYQRAVLPGVSALKELLGDRVRDRNSWSAFKGAYFRRVERRPDAELAETFFNSMTRRVFVTVGVDPEVEFVAPLVVAPPEGAHARVTKTFVKTGKLVDLVHRVLSEYRFRVDYENVHRDAELVTRHIEQVIAPDSIELVEVAHPVFFRNKAAYIVGRILARGTSVPLVLALLNNENGVIVDAVLLTEDEVSIVFSFTRSYFLVNAECPSELVGFLRTIMPRKPIAELYIAIGHNKHGKTELFRALLRHLETSNDQFELARGDRGMVMIVFTLPSHDIILKVFRDHFDYPKTTTPQDVKEKYQLVFKHDRAGRLVDAQEFEFLEFDKSRFAPSLLEELTKNARDTVAVEGDSVVIRHLYAERRLMPLNLYLKEASEDDARAAILDYGQAIRDLAATNIFPGDLLTKNFGVTRHQRLVFYDYDELCLLTDCNFRRLPRPRDTADEVAADPWFYVGERDVFPEEFLSFLGFRADMRELFVAAHADLLDVDFWLQMQREQEAGRVVDIFPYMQDKRLSGF